MTAPETHLFWGGGALASAPQKCYLWRASLGFVPASFEVDTALEVLGEVAVILEGGKEEWTVRKD